MTRLFKGPFELAVMLVLLTAPMTAPLTAQESATQEAGPDQLATLQRSGLVEFGRVERSPDRPNTLLLSDRSAVSARSVLLSGLEQSKRYVWPSPPADESTADEVQEAAGRVDAWGVAPNFPLATGQLLLQNVITWAFNEYIKKGDISQINPDTWWTNITSGFGYDDNEFQVNFMAHPYQGSAYFNSGRANGFNYWESTAFAVAGSFNWECCGETHLMSINDWIMTSIGGAFLGETFYRLSSAVLDNEATGSERAWREVGAFAINPARGFTRVVEGRAFEQAPNPTNPLDHLGTRLSNILSFGFRMVGEGESLDFSEDEAHFFVEMDLAFGTPFAMERNKPFDYFTFKAQLNFRDKGRLGLMQGRANLYSFGQSGSDTSQHLFSVMQYHDYINNNAYEFGGESVGLAYLSNWIRSERTRLVAAIDVHAMLMGGINTKYAAFAEIPGVRERAREYDFGPGFGSWFNFYWLRDEFRVVDLGYRINWLHTLNGSNVGGQDTDHIVQQFNLKLQWPLTDLWGLGAEGSIFLRNSYFDEEDFGDVRQRNPELKVYGTWRVGTRGIN